MSNLIGYKRRRLNLIFWSLCSNTIWTGAHHWSSDKQGLKTVDILSETCAKTFAKWIKINLYQIIKLKFLFERNTVKWFVKNIPKTATHNVKNLNIAVFVVYIYNTHFFFPFVYHILYFNDVCVFMTNWNWLDFCNQLSSFC